MAVTKIRKGLKSEYHVWNQDELNINDIIDVYTSLGRQARNITIEAIGGDVQIRFNVCHEIFKNQEAVGNRTYLGADAAFFKSPIMADEIEVEKPNVTIEASSTHFWKDEFPVKDIKIIQLAPITRITVS